MNKIKNYLEDNKCLLIALSIIILLIFGSYLIGKERFLLGYDYQYQHLYFYQDFMRIIQGGEMPFWSNNLFLGTNFWGSKSYYILGDPFAYFVLLFSRDNLVNALMFTYILKFITAALLFNHFLFKLNINNKVRFIPVLMYAFCGWAMLFAEHPMFLVWHTFLPLLFIGVENVLAKNKYATFIFAIFILFVSNYYFFFTTSVFLTFYWTIRYYQLKDFKFKVYLIDTIKLIGYYLIGVLMGSFLMIPSILHLIQSPRVIGDNVITKKWNPVCIYLDMLVKSFIAPYQVNELGQMLFNTTEYSTNQLSLYSSAITLLLLPQIFVMFKGKIRNGFILLLAIELVLLITPYGASLMHGFKEPTFRWTLLLIVSEVIVVAYILNNYEKINKCLLAFTSILLVLIIFILRYAARCSYDAIWDHLLPEYNGLLIALVVIVLVTIILMYKKYSIIFIGFILIVELSYSSYKTLHRYPAFENYDYEHILSKEAVEYIQNIEGDNSFYRIYVPYTHNKAAMPHNINLYYDYMGAYTYDSLYQFTIAPFIENELHTSPAIWQIDIKDINLLKKLHFKYFLVQDPVFNLGKEQWHKEIIDLRDYPEYKLVNKVDGYYIYEVMDYDSFPLDLEIFKNNYLKGNILSDKAEYLRINIAYDKGWSAIVNGNKVNVKSDGGFISIPIIKGNNVVELRFVPRGFIIGSIISLLAFILFVFVLIKERFETE